MIANPITHAIFFQPVTAAAYVSGTVSSPGLLTYYSTNSVYTFTASCTMSITNTNNNPFDILCVGGGGGGASNIGGGGAGGQVGWSASVILPTGTYYVYVGAGGLGGRGSANNNGNNGIATTLISASITYITASGGISGSSLGAGYYGYGGKGWGGAGGGGTSGYYTGQTKGSSGSLCNINGSSSYWGGGGGAGGGTGGGSGTGSIGAPYGGGNGAMSSAVSGSNGSPNSGGGAGGGWWINQSTWRGGGTGSAGIVILATRYY